jgi:DUF4097 and DUF4098 domain-containing protein YvlB
MHRFSTPTPPQLSVEFRAGSITIRSDDVQETTVDLRGRSDDAATRSLLDDTVVDQRGGTVVVHVPKRSGGLFGRTPELLLDITAPHGSRLHVQTASADLSAHGSYGESTVASGSGDVFVERLTGSAHVRSGSGDVVIRSTTSDLTVGTGSGDVRLGTTEGDMSLQSGSGDIAVDSARAEVKVQTGSGDLRIGRAEDDVKAQTGSGDIEVAQVSRGRIRAKSASGDLGIGVVDGVAAWLDVRTLTGSVSSDLEASEAVGAEEQHVRLELSTVSGDIDITRV